MRKAISHCPEPMQLFLGYDIWGQQTVMAPAVPHTPLGATHYIHATPLSHPPLPDACWGATGCHPISSWPGLAANVLRLGAKPYVKVKAGSKHNGLGNAKGGQESSRVNLGE
ncbi:hypothetical protein AOLI_G00024830 [Acnodon oligacanthus]